MMNQVAATQAGARTAESWTLLDFDRELAVERTWECLEKALLSIPTRASAPNAIATLVAPNGNTLSIGIAGQGDQDNPDLRQPLATIEYNHASQDPPYLVVIGDPSLTCENGEIVVFRFEGQWTEILQRNCVPVGVMIQVVKHYFDTGTLPEWIAWEQA
jgi:hypothetical protein